MQDFSKYLPEHISMRRILAIGIFLLCATAAWLRGGVYPAMQWPMAVISILLCGGLLFLHPKTRARFVNGLLHDKVFCAGAVLLLVILLQSLNSRYWIVEDEVGAVGFLRTPGRWLPWSVSPLDAIEMLAWFFPAWVVILLVRHLLERRHLKVILYLLAWNSALLGLVSLIQYLLGADRILGMWEVPGHWFFATFDYPNHAAAWFYLNAFLSAGLMHDSLQKKRPPVQLGVWCASFFLCIVAAAMTASRFGALVSLGLLVAMLVLVFKKSFPKVKGDAAVNLVIAAMIAILVGITVFFGAGKGSLAREVNSKGLFGESSVVADMEGRLDQIPHAWRIFKTYPVFGSGGWGYRWLVQIYVQGDEYEAWNAMGKANVHCDPLQFLSEFGFVGAACMALTVVLLIRQIVLTGRYPTLSVWVLVGLGMVLLHSLFDLPFRSPAILLEWCLLLALLPKLPRRDAGTDKNT